MTIDNASDLKTLWTQRAFYYGADHRVMDDLVGVYNGILPAEYDEFFHEEMKVHLINAIRLAWDDLAALAGKTFQLYVPSDNDTPTAEKRAEKQEQIGYGYNRAGRFAGAIDMDLLMKVLMWWVVGCANAVLMVLPDYEHQTPYFTFRDPRSHFPPLGWDPYSQTRLTDSLFAYRMSIAELKARYPDKADAIRNSVKRNIALAPIGRRGAMTDDEVFVWVGEYYHEDTWMTATMEDQVVTLVRSDDGDKGHPGVNPVIPFGLYNPDTAKGRSFFADQISIQAAMARMFSQKLDYFDRTLYPVIFTTPLAGKNIKIGPFAVNEYDVNIPGVNPRMDTIAPSNVVDADQTIQMALGLSRMLNRNPESFQGQGEADSAKALDRLHEGVDRVVRSNIWPAAIAALPVAYSTAARLDVKLWPNVKKSAHGSRKGSPFRVNYRPNVDLRGREYDFEMETPITVGGYMGVLQAMQLVQAEQLSEESAAEQNENIPNAKEELRKIDASRVRKLQWADLQAKVGQGMIQPGALHEIEKAINKGEDLTEVVAKLEQQGRLMVQMPEMGPEGAAAGAAGATPDIVPTLDAIRRGA